MSELFQEEHEVSESGDGFLDDIRRQVFPEKQSEEEIRDIIFDALVARESLRDFEEALDESGFDEGEIDGFKEALGNMSTDDLKRILSLPWELRKRRLGSFRQALDDGVVTPEDIARTLAEEGQKRGFTLGYHLSNADIHPKGVPGKQDEFRWEIVGKELDDRDEMNMAYYSLDYHNLFRKKQGKFLYAVRAETGQDTPHKTDQENRWGRAPLLSVVQRLDVGELDRNVDEIFSKLEK